MKYFFDDSKQEGMCIVKIYEAAAAVGTGCVTLLVAPPLRLETRDETGKTLRAVLVN